MWFPIFAWIVLLGALAFFARATLDLDPARISILFSALPGPQRLAIGAIVITTLSLIGSSVWQAQRLVRQNRSLRDRLKGIRQGTVVAQGSQNQFDAAVQHLIDADPEEAISSLQAKLADTEQRAALQQGRSESVDMQDRFDDIRRRQQALREMIGVVAEKRRAIEPVFVELKDRQRQLERSLSEIEIDDNKNSLALRLNELDHDVSSIHARQGVLQESLTTLNRFKEELGKSQAELVPLRAADTGIDALIDELRLRRDQLIKSVDELESSGDEKLNSRVEALSRSKLEVQQRVARLDDCFNILNAIRLDFEELGERRAHLERSFAEVETDSSGTSLADRQNALNEFVIQCRLRLGRLQDSLATLNQFKDELAKSQAELAPLQAPVFGIEALIGEVNTSRDSLVKTLGEIEFKGDEKLGSRVEALSTNKLEIDERIAQVFENFQKLDSMRKDIGGTFTAIRNTLNKIG
jgi:chromosome segregation ATPase